MSLRWRIGNAVGQVVSAGVLGYVLLRIFLAGSLAFSVGVALYHMAALAGLAGHPAFCVGVAIGVFAAAQPFSFSEHRFNFGLVATEAFRAAAVVLFVALACVLRVVVERLGLEPLAEVLTRVHLEFLATAPVVWHVPLPIVLAGVAVFVLAAFLEQPEKQPAYDGPNPDEVVLRNGPTRVPYPAVLDYNRREFAGQPCVSWALVALPIFMARLGLELAGSPQTGKTILLTILLKSFAALMEACQPRSGETYRAFIADIKGDYRMALAALAPNIDAQFIHPSDRNSWCWDIAVDVTKRTLRAFVQALFRPEPDTKADPFWIGQLYNIAEAVGLGMFEMFGTNWTLADYLEWIGTLETARIAIGRAGDHLVAAQAAELFSERFDDKLRDSLFATVSERCGKLRNIAVSWRALYKEGRRASIRQFVKNPRSFLVFGWDKDHDIELQYVFAGFFELLGSSMLAHGSTRGGQLVLLDELPALGPGVGRSLGTLSREGKDLNIILAVAYQSRSALNVSMGEQEAAAALAEQRFLVALGTADHTTASELSDDFGQVETERRVTSKTTSQNVSGSTPDGKSTTENVVRETKPLISAAQIQKLPIIIPGGARGPTFFAKDTNGNVYAAELPMADVRRLLPKPERFQVEPFSEEELERFALRVPRVDEPAAPSKNGPSNNNPAVGSALAAKKRQRRPKRSLVDELEDLRHA